MRKKKENKTPQVILVAFIAFIMVTSVIGFIWSGSPKVRYNGFSFEQTPEGYYTEVGGKRVDFYYLPSDVESISVPDGALAKLENTAQIDMTSSYNDTNNEAIALVMYEISRALDGLYVRQGFTEENPYEKPVITCNETGPVPVVHLMTSSENDISVKDNCITIEARDPRNFIIIKDRILYSLLGIIG